MKTTLSGLIRDASYEALFHLGGFLALSIHPTGRNLEQIEQWIDESIGRKQQLRRLQAMGLVEAEEDREGWVPRLTDSGRAAFAGGRNPVSAWSRDWDGKWRMLSFDLPRKASRGRMVLRRWMQRNHLGRLQGSLWLSPDPVPSFADVMEDQQLDPSAVVVFEGQPVGIRHPREVAAAAWNFGSINADYDRYNNFATRQLAQLTNKPPTPNRVGLILREDRKRWWNAIRQDPLLPSQLHPPGYRGEAAWKSRCRLLKTLGRSTGLDAPDASQDR